MHPSNYQPQPMNIPRTILTIGLLLVTLLSHGQTPNHVRTYKARIPIKDSLSATNDRSKVQEAVQYLDGLGRPLQSVARSASSAGNDVVSFHQYDQLGRELKQYLPFVRSTSSGVLTTDPLSSQQSFHNQHYGGSSGNYAFAEVEIEASPAARPLRQGAPGQVWQLSGNHTVATEYKVNITADEVRLLKVTNNTIEHLTDYPAGELAVSIIKDENNGSAEGEAQTFSNKSGQVVLKRSKADNGTYLETYYVYDDYGQLRYVIPPAGIAALGTIAARNWNLLDDGGFQARWMFCYRYDSRGRMTAKRVPGSDWIHMIYDQRDRLVLTQDGNQRDDNIEEVNDTLVVDGYKGKNYKIRSEERRVGKEGRSRGAPDH